MPTRPLTWLNSCDSERRFFWALGILETRACFMCGRPSQPRTPRIELEMRDAAAVGQVAKLFHANVGSRTREGTPTYNITIGGRRAAALMRKLHGFLGERCQKQIERAVTEYGRLTTVWARDLEAELCAAPLCLADVDGDSAWCAGHGRHMAVHHG